jgi:hypothetical protein
MRTRLILTSLVSIAALASGCGGGSDVPPAKGDTSAKTVKGEDSELENADLRKFFDAIATSDPDKMAAVESLVAPGSIAAAYLQEQTDASNAAIDAGLVYQAGTTEKVKGGYQNCDKTEDEPSCVTWTDLEQVGGKLAKFTINDIDISDRISVGDGSKQKAGELATVEFLSAYKSVQSDQIFINVRVTSGNEKLMLDTYSATYRGADKRQSTATDSTGPTELDADSTAYLSLIFKASKIGGVAKLRILDEDYNRDVEVAIKTS